MYKQLCLLTRSFGTISLGREANRRHLIMAIILHVTCLFNDMQILVGEPASLKTLHVHGCFDLVLQQGTRKVYITEARNHDMDRGAAQNLLGCDVVADAESSSCVPGIITNYVEWIFIRSLDHKIQRDHSSLHIEAEQLNKHGLELIAGKVYTLLSS